MEVEKFRRDLSKQSEPPSLEQKSPGLAAWDCTAAAMRRETDGTLESEWQPSPARKYVQERGTVRCVSEPETEQTLRSQQGGDAKGEGRGRRVSRELYLQRSSASARDKRKSRHALECPRPGT